MAFLFVPHVSAQSQEDLDLLRLYYRDKDLVFTPTRTLQPVSRTAENVTIVTAEEIEKMNAHTLTDVLNTVPGVQIQIRGGPGIASDVNIQGSDNRHVLVLIDGVKLNSLAGNLADIGSIPVQMIERVEILKGPGSSTWGSSLGGVINIITKSPDGGRPFGGVASVSYGERRTGDYRAEVTGTKGRVGYYIYAGYLGSGGFAPRTSVYENNTYSKLVWSLPKGNITWTGGYVNSYRGEGAYPKWGESYSLAIENMFSTLSLSFNPADDLDVNVSARAIKNRSRQYVSTNSQPAYSLPYGDHTVGGSAGASYKHGIHNLVVGADFDDGETDGSWVNGRHSLRTLAFFANDAVTIGKISIIPGIRYDHTNTNGGYVSPSVGIAYKIGESTTLRGYGARGFNVPPLSSLYSTTPNFVRNPDLEVEKVSSLQIGVESFALKYLWFKTTLFRHDISDAISILALDDGVSYTPVNIDRQRRQGIEVEVKTRPILHFSLSAGTTYIDAQDRKTEEPLSASPRYTYDIGIEYSNNAFLFALLKGHYIRFNGGPSWLGTKDRTFVWDIHASKTVLQTPHATAQVFFTIHNVFNSDQFLDATSPNPSRWAELGLRVKF